MTHIKITKGLDIPIKGSPLGNVHPLIPSGGSSPFVPAQIALDLKPFDDIKFKILVKVGDAVKIGQPLLEDKSSPGRLFCSPAAGVISDIRRGLKRSLLAIVIDVANKEEHQELPRLEVESASREQLIETLKSGGLFAHIRVRPFNRLADPAKAPRSVFVKAVESAPFVPPAELQIEGREREFQIGLNALAKLSDGPVHLVYRHGNDCRAFTDGQGVQRHTVEGPHPVSNASLHIQAIDPIKSSDDVIWTVSAQDVVAIGYLLMTGRYYTERVISIAGPGVIEDRTGFFKGRAGLPISGLISGRIERGAPLRLISGDPLMGRKVEVEDFLGFNDFVFCVIPENTDREFLHFFRLGKDKYSFSRAYLSGHLDNAQRRYDFTTSQHGEHRAFIDATLYDEVMPLPISTMLLVKAVMAEDFELAEKLGLIGVDSEDFALPTFVCPSKVEMMDIMKSGLRQFAHDVLS